MDSPPVHLWQRVARFKQHLTNAAKPGYKQHDERRNYNEHACDRASSNNPHGSPHTRSGISERAFARCILCSVAIVAKGTGEVAAHVTRYCPLRPFVWIPLRSWLATICGHEMFHSDTLVIGSQNTERHVNRCGPMRYSLLPAHLNFTPSQ